MYKITVRIKADKCGAYRAQDIIRQIVEQIPDLQMPAKPIAQISISELTYGGKPCGHMTAYGVPNTFDRTVGEWMQRDAILYFI